jgi:alkylated DNA repair protein (DNA oxidative demethylase)
MSASPAMRLRRELAAAFRLAEKFGYSEGICNHFSVVVPGSQERYLINPYGLHWSEMRPEHLLLIDAWSELTGFIYPPQACLVNHYAGRARLGLHRDEDEADFSAPILSVSLGDTAIFRIGGLKRRDPTQSVELRSGDVLLMGGESRLRYHGIDRVLAGTSDLLEEGGRLNLTMRYVGA